jgi:hypothetical protein
VCVRDSTKATVKIICGCFENRLEDYSMGPENLCMQRRNKQNGYAANSVR